MVELFAGRLQQPEPAQVALLGGDAVQVGQAAELGRVAQGVRDQHQLVAFLYRNLRGKNSVLLMYVGASMQLCIAQCIGVHVF